MAEPRQPKPANWGTGLYKHLPATVGTAGSGDTFFGPRDKAYADFHARDLTRVRGKNAWYYVLDDQVRRVDGTTPLSDAPHQNNVTTPEDAEPDPFARTSHAGFALYGERVKIGQRTSSVTREIQPDWPYLQPILVRGVLYGVEHSEEPDERGSIYIRNADFDLARVLCEIEWDFQPREGDVVRFEHLGDKFFDVEEVSRDEARWGGSGFFVSYKLRLTRTTKYDPSRKIAARKLIDAPPSGVVDPNPGGLS